MPKRISNKPVDISQAAHLMVERSTAEHSEPVPHKPTKMSKAQVSRIMSAMGRRGGKIGGKRRLETMTPEKRKEVALLAAKTRWAKKKK